MFLVITLHIFMIVMLILQLLIMMLRNTYFTARFSTVLKMEIIAMNGK